MNLESLVSEFSTMPAEQRNQALLAIAHALGQSGGRVGGEASGNLEILQYMTRQPVVLRGLRLLGVKITEEIAIHHPEEHGKMVNIPKKDFNPEIHEKFELLKKKVAALPVAPPVPPVKTEKDGEDDTDEEEVDGDEDDEDEDSEDGAEGGELKPKGRKGKGKGK